MKEAENENENEIATYRREKERNAVANDKKKWSTKKSSGNKLFEYPSVIVRVISDENFMIKNLKK